VGLEGKCLVKVFANNWHEKEKGESVASKIKNVTKPSVGLKEQIATVTQRLDAQTRTLEGAVQRFQNRDAEIYNRVVKALAQHDTARANILATELAEIRKVEKMLSHASLGLQSMSMRLSTVSELGDVVAILSPAKSMINSIRTEMCGIMPEASQELGNIGNILNDIVSQTSQGSDMPVDIAGATPEAMEILQEAETAAARQLEEQFPTFTPEKQVQKRTSIEASN